MYKTRTIRYQTRKDRSLDSEGNYQRYSQTEPTSSTLSGIDTFPVSRLVIELQKKNLCKTPININSLGVTNKVHHNPLIGTPIPKNTIKNNPHSRCHKCKHINLDHLQRVTKTTRNNNSNNNNINVVTGSSTRTMNNRFNFAASIDSDNEDDSFGLANPGTVWSPDTSSLVQQYKANIAISPYVRHYLERKLKDKLLKAGKSDSQLVQSLANLDFSELELVYSVKSKLSLDECSLKKYKVSTIETQASTTPTTAKAGLVGKAKLRVRVKKNRTTTNPTQTQAEVLHNFHTDAHACIKLNLNQNTNSILNFGQNSYSNQSEKIVKSHHYFTRTQARLLAQSQKEVSSRQHSQHSHQSFMNFEETLKASQAHNQKKTLSFKTKVKTKIMSSVPKRNVINYKLTNKTSISKRNNGKQQIRKVKNCFIATKSKSSISSCSAMITTSKTESAKSKIFSIRKISNNPNCTWTEQQNQPLDLSTFSRSLKKSKIPRYTGESLRTTDVGES